MFSPLRTSASRSCMLTSTQLVGCQPAAVADATQLSRMTCRIMHARQFWCRSVERDARQFLGVVGVPRNRSAAAAAAAADVTKLSRLTCWVSRCSCMVLLVFLFVLASISGVCFGESASEVTSRNPLVTQSHVDQVHVRQFVNPITTEVPAGKRSESYFGYCPTGGGGAAVPAGAGAAWPFPRWVEGTRVG